MDRYSIRKEVKDGKTVYELWNETKGEPMMVDTYKGRLEYFMSQLEREAA